MESTDEAIIRFCSIMKQCEQQDAVIEEMDEIDSMLRRLTDRYEIIGQLHKLNPAVDIEHIFSSMRAFWDTCKEKVSQASTVSNIECKLSVDNRSVEDKIKAGTSEGISAGMAQMEAHWAKRSSGNASTQSSRLLLTPPDRVWQPQWQAYVDRHASRTREGDPSNSTRPQRCNDSNE